MDFKDPIDWQGIKLSKSDLFELNSAAVDIYRDKAVSREAAWIEAMLALLNRKGYLRLPNE